MSGGHSGGPKPLGDPGAPGGIDLETIHGLGRAHPLEVREIVAVLPGRDVDGGETPDLVKASQIVIESQIRAAITLASA